MAVRKNLLAAAAALSMCAGIAHASVVVNGTRLVYDASDREITVKLNNVGNDPALVQVWLDTGNPKSLPDEVQVPFSMSPPLFRLDPKKGQSLRLIYTQDPLPQDKESLFWLNVLEVPPTAAQKDAVERNMLRLAFRSRIKLFFRPDGLPGRADEAPAKISWKFVPKKDGAGYVLEATNPTPYHVTFTQVVAKAGGATWTDDKGGMVDPGATQDYDVGKVASLPAAPLQVDYKFLNDYGAGTPGQYKPARAAAAATPAEAAASAPAPQAQPEAQPGPQRAAQP
ncbi:fimbria/pilus periplasmic chaperone [Paraburkholderia sp. MMS20-SJTR3]|uniref:Fimbria/pilus periplasmic chaperone n=1 Tax=Paraburkholderia sejongensis TaxID=2886946 RepID=A0ABS8JX35_9BURK|nr:fimbria/pilus periplasmic chaperone [Paraburkholderia sp. MMS20-SJTR3]MCC8394456.1 fimbria/pilus periplasmic chaperone [Paraburkholderia sp. MMS20-SJTR3]